MTIAKKCAKPFSHHVYYKLQFMYQVEHFLNESNQDLYQDWLEGLRDRTARARITVRIGRLAAGAFGDCKPVGEGVWELRIDHGPGYRVYYAQIKSQLILLLLGGTKQQQTADIKMAIKCWKKFQRSRQ
jgi:putative addiction module killer protein